MSGIGERIAAARNERRLTPVEVARRLRIRTELIQAIEDENWARLGPPSYARGFVRNYARLLGIESDGLTEQLDAAIPRSAPDVWSADATPASPPPRPMVVEPTPVERARNDQGRSHFYPWLLGAMSMLAAILVVAVAWYTFAPGPREVATQSQAQSQAQSAGPRAPAPQDDAIFSGGRAGAAQPSESKSGVDLTLQLTQDSWLSVTVDGKRVLYETLPAGTVRDFHGAREITLRAGNAGGVNAVIDGQPLGTLGQHGQVEDRFFAAKGSASSIGPRE